MESLFEESLGLSKPRPTYIRMTTNRMRTSYSVISAMDGHLPSIPPGNRGLLPAICVAEWPFGTGPN
jgi:hypothetical protein